MKILQIVEPSLTVSSVILLPEVTASEHKPEYLAFDVIVI